MNKRQPMISVVTPNGDRTVPAVAVYGAWAAHRGIGPGAPTWCITYVPSGRCVPRSHTDLLTKQQAIDVAFQLDAQLGTGRATLERGKRVITIIHNVLTDKAA